MCLYDWVDQKNTPVLTPYTGKIKQTLQGHIKVQQKLGASTSPLLEGNQGMRMRV